MVRVVTLALLTAALWATAEVASAQLSRTDTEAVVVRGDQLHAAMQPGEALTILEEVLFDDPRNYAVLWRAARESSVLGVAAQDDRIRMGRFKQAEAYARLAVGSDEDGIEGHYWLCVALAGVADVSAPQARLPLLEEARDQASLVLGLDPNHPGGHAAMGNWHASVMRMSGLASLVARNVLGGDAVRDASWDDAERLLARAVELDPNNLTYRLSLAFVYRDTERPDRARAQLQEVLARPVAGPLDQRAKDQARTLLIAMRDGTQH
jgi:tetratricopeptide (TPR) repeat protein